MKILEKEDNWIQTYTGTKFSFNNPSIESVNIVDIAHSLSMIPRFTGHAKRHYSVAQHSLTMCAVMRAEGESKKVALAGLLHDAHEAYIGDISSPFKDYLLSEFFLDISQVEAPIIKVIEERFGVDLTSEGIKNTIKNYDSIMLRTEAESLFDKVIGNWTGRIQLKLKNRIKTILTPLEAKVVFIETFNRLKEENDAE